MKRKLIPLLIAGVMVVGCGKTEGSVKENSAAQGNATAEEVQEIDSQDDSNTKEQHKDDVVEGNGTFFVSVNDKVYFRKYDAETFSDASLNSEYTNLWRGGLTTEYSKKSEICAYDPKTKLVETIAEDDGCHEIYYLDGLFYLTKKEDDRFKTYTLNIDTKEVKPADNIQGAVLNVDAENGYIVTGYTNYDTDESYAYIYKDGEEVYSKTAKRCEYLGSSNGKVYIYQAESDGDDSTNFTFWELNPADKSEVCLGTINPEKETNDEFLINWQVEDFATNNDKIYVSFADYEGSGNFWNGGMCVEATAGAENSLSVLYDNSKMEEGNMYVDDSGKVSFVTYTPGSYTLSGYDKDARPHGDLVYYETVDDKKVIAKDFVDEQVEDGVFEQNIPDNAITRIGDSTYVALPNYVHDDINDIGWRFYYKVLRVRYLAIDGNGEVTVMDSVDTTNNFLQVEASYDKASNALEGKSVGNPAGEEETEERTGEYDYVYKLADDFEYVEDGKAKSKDDFAKYIGSDVKRFKLYFNDKGLVEKIEKV